MTAFDVVKKGVEKIRCLLTSLHDPEIIDEVSSHITFLETNVTQLTVRDDLGGLRKALFSILPALCGTCMYCIGILLSDQIPVQKDVVAERPIPDCRGRNSAERLGSM